MQDRWLVPRNSSLFSGITSVDTRCAGQLRSEMASQNVRLGFHLGKEKSFKKRSNRSLNSFQAKNERRNQLTEAAGGPNITAVGSFVLP